MRKVIALLLFCLPLTVCGQLLQTAPRFIREADTDPVTLMLNPALGNQQLSGYTAPVYIHIGLITNKSTGASDWKHVISTWGVADPAFACTHLPSGTWAYTIKGGLRSYFAVTDTSEHITRICILFRNADGSLKAANADGSDMYLPVYPSGLKVRVENPIWQPAFDPVYAITNVHPGDSIQVTGYASQKTSLSLLLNGTAVKTVRDTMITATIRLTATGEQHILLKALTGTDSSIQDLPFSTVGLTDTAALPDGLSQGINYQASDPTKATLVLYAPLKKSIYVIGDFNEWQKGQDGYQMHVTPDGRLFWCTLTHLEARKPYAYQYIIDDTITVADYNAHLILDKANDPYIERKVYPDLPAFPAKASGTIVSVLETGQADYTWKTTSFTRPAASSLRVYELLVRDFVQDHDWQSLTDSLAYLQTLGINAIELMPFNEFEGNSSWGYNPDFYFAPDKYYGPEYALKTFIDSCHSRGIAVIMDMVLNHSFGQSPMVQMYYDNTTGRPGSSNPWFNPVAKHAYNVGYDLNHESQATRAFTKRVLAYWLSEYRVDGFRFDLAKGFTQKQTCDDNGTGCDVDSWSAYDASRVAIWDDYYAAQQKDAPGSYCILEFLGNNQEEKHYSDEGMLLWENGNTSFNQLTMGYTDGSDISSFLYTNRGWTNNNMMLYQESHDEERLMYKNIQYGNSSGKYNIKDTLTALQRNAMSTALWSAIPGPKMLWQFGELGYDYTINYCIDGSGNNNCKTAPQPMGWAYLMSNHRMALHNVYQQMFRLRTAYPDAFSAGQVDPNSILTENASNLKSLILTSDSLDLAVMTNFDVTAHTTTLNLPDTGIWIPYIMGTGSALSFIDTNTAYLAAAKDSSMHLAAGGFAVLIHPKKVIPAADWISDLVVKTVNKQTTISWKNTHTKDSTQFIVERNQDNGAFTPVAYITATTADGHYQYTDLPPTEAASLSYRVAVVNMHGIGYSDPLKAGRAEVAGKLTVYPNPSSGVFHIQLSAGTGDNPYTVYNAAGAIVAKGIFPASGGDLSLTYLAAGVYFLKVSSDHAILKTKLLKR